MLATLLIIFAGCSQEMPGDGPSSDLPNLITPALAEQITATSVSNGDVPTPARPPAPTRSIIPDTGWEEVGQGLERRVVNVEGPDGQSTQSLYLLRIDPDHHRFDVGYHPGNPQSLLAWGEETKALIVVNGGYFTEENQATNLVITDGIGSGSSYHGFGGMFSVDNQGPRLRWLSQQPYDETEPANAGFQSFPMLVTPGGKLGYKDESGEKARRTVIAEDRDGRILLIISPSATFTLAEMSRYLTNSDLDIEAALNLDGGASTGLLLADPAEGIPAFSELPLVLLVYPR